MFGAIQGLINALQTKSANEELEGLLAQDPTYKSNPFAAQQLGIAQQYLNGRMAGAGSQERNIYNTQANTNAGIDRSATDSSQALALKMATQGQSNDAFGNLQTKEAQNKYAMLDNLDRAYGGMINEGDKVYQDTVRRYGDTVQIKGQERQNKTNAVNGIFNGINNDFNQAFQVAGSLFGMPSMGSGASAGGGQYGNTQPSGWNPSTYWPQGFSPSPYQYQSQGYNPYQNNPH